MNASRVLALGLLAVLAASVVTRGGASEESAAAVQLSLAALGLLAACSTRVSASGAALPVAFGWIGLALAAPLWAVDRDAALDASGGLVAGALTFLIASTALRSADRRWLPPALIVLGVAVVLVAGWGSRTGGASAYPFGNPNHLAGFLLVPGGIALGGLAGAHDSSRGGALVRFAAATALAVIAAGIVGTGSRGAIAAAVAAAVGMLALRTLPRRWGVSGVAVSFATLAVSIVAVPAVWPDLLPIARNGSESSAGIRWAIYAASTRAALTGAPLGTGPGGFAPAFAPERPVELPYVPRFAHDEVLHGLVVLGIPFALALVATGWAAWRRFAPGRKRPSGAVSLGCAAALLAVAAHSLVDFPLHIPAIALAAAVLLGIAWRAEAGLDSVRVGIHGRVAIAAVSVVLALIAGTRAMVIRAEADSDTALVAGEFAVAEDAAARGLRLRPARSSLLARRAQAARLSFELAGGGPTALERALRASERARSASPNRADLSLALADLRGMSDDVVGALRAAEHAAARDPGSPAVHLARARWLARASRDVDAAAAVRDAVLRDARLAEPAIAALVRATGDASLAAVAVPEDPVALAGAGRALRDAGHSREAARAFARLLALRPEDLRAALDTARNLRAAGEREGALAVLTRAWRRAPGDARIVREFGMHGVDPAGRIGSAS